MVICQSQDKTQRSEEKGGVLKNYRNRENEILFMDLRNLGHPYEKKYVQFTPEDREKIVKTFHDWRSADSFEQFCNVKEYCYSAKKEEIAANDYSLVSSKYIEFDRNADSVDYDAEMKKIQAELQRLLKEEEKSRKELLSVLDEIGYGIKL